jgi:hypothetical protein
MEGFLGRGSLVRCLPVSLASSKAERVGRRKEKKIQRGKLDKSPADDTITHSLQKEAAMKRRSWIFVREMQVYAP